MIRQLHLFTPVLFLVFLEYILPLSAQAVDCNSRPCQNSGICIPLEEALDTGGGGGPRNFFCQCIGDSSGTFCELSLPASNSMPIYCDFETNLCGFRSDSYYNFSIGHGKTITPYTGPDGDHTTGKGRYMFVESSYPIQIGSIFYFTSPIFRTSGSYCLQFWYHMYGNTVGKLQVFQVAKEDGNDVMTEVWSREGNLGPSWKWGILDLTFDGFAQIRFKFQTRGFLNDVALDDIVIAGGKCPQDPFAFGKELPWSCDFEKDSCSFVVFGDSASEWQRQILNDSFIHKQQGFVMSSQSAAPKKFTPYTSRLVSPAFIRNGPVCISFDVFSLGTGANWLTVKQETVNNVVTNTIHSLHDKQYDGWKSIELQVKYFEAGSKVVLETSLADQSSFFAIDSFSVSTRKCKNPVMIANNRSEERSTEFSQAKPVFSCSFEKDWCGFETSKQNLEWQITQGMTPSLDTGPNGDHTTGSGQYVYIEASLPAVPGNDANLTSVPLNVRGSSCLTFSYHMKGDGIGTLNVYVNDKRLWSKSLSQGDFWNYGFAKFDSEATNILSFQAIRGVTFRGDIALDDISVIDGDCPKAASMTVWAYRTMLKSDQLYSDPAVPGGSTNTSQAGNAGGVIFAIKSRGQSRILLFTNEDKRGLSYGISLQETGTKSILREYQDYTLASSRTSKLLKSSDPSRPILNPAYYKFFWVTWLHRQLRFGEGSDPRMGLLMNYAIADRTVIREIGMEQVAGSLLEASVSDIEPIPSRDVPTVDINPRSQVGGAEDFCKMANTISTLPVDQGVPKCFCKPGFTGAQCNLVDPCPASPNTCSGTNGRCIRVTDTEFKCVCNKGFFGGKCQRNTTTTTTATTTTTSCGDTILANPCLNGGACLDQPGLPNKFKCICIAGFLGDRCERKDPCYSEKKQQPICRNGGYCASLKGTGAISCKCTVDFAGRYCELRNVCKDKKCDNGGQCQVTAKDKWECVCPVGTEGPTCDSLISVDGGGGTVGTTATSIDGGQCGSTTCQNGGTCFTWSSGEIQCLCLNGYTGITCERIDYCSSRPCFNDGVCQTDLTSFKCICKPPYDGKQCQISTGSTPKPPTKRPSKGDRCDILRPFCQNGAVCIFIPGTTMPRCKCKEPYTGVFCTKKLHQKVIWSCSFPNLRTSGRSRCGMYNSILDPNGYRWVLRSGPAPNFPRSGPKSDHTGAAGSHYMMIVFKPAQRNRQPAPNKRISLLTNFFRTWGKSGLKCITFWYYMYGTDVNKLEVIQRTGGKLLKRIEGNQGPKWSKAHVRWNSRISSQFRINGFTGNGPESDIAIDDIIVYDGDCYEKDEPRIISRKPLPLNVASNG